MKIEWPYLIRCHTEWLTARGYASSTVSSRGAHLRRFGQWGAACGLAALTDYDLSVIEEYRLHLHGLRGRDGTPLGWGSKAQALLAIKGLFRWLTLTRRIPSNPAADVELPRRERRLPRAVLSAADMERVLMQPDIRRPEGLRDRAILELLYSTGIRRAECAGLALSDLDADRQTVLVRSGKGRADRYVPIGRRAAGWVDRYVREARPRQCAGSEPQVLFLSRHGSGLSPKHLGNRVRRHMQRAGVEGQGACHVIRHTTATLLLEGGADIRYIQEILGHRQLSTTAIYTRVSIGRLQEVHARCHPAAS